MAKTEYTFDPSKVYEMFRQFDETSRKKVFRSTLRKAAGILVRDTRRKLKERIGEAADHPNRWNGKKLSAGVTAKVAKNNRMIKVNILGDFRLKFFEKGTDVRYTKGGFGFYQKSGHRGRMKPNYYFRTAKAASEGKVFSSISKDLAKTIERINKKQHG